MSARDCIAYVRSLEIQGEKLTKWQRMLFLLQDYKWHSSREIALKVTHRFSDCVFILKNKGIEVEKRLCEYAPKGEIWYEYKLKGDKSD